MALLNICHRCEHRQRPCAGPCACTLDNIDIRDHAASGSCPLNKFTPDDVTSQPQPKPPEPIPRIEWPIWVNAIALWSDESDAGIGDTVHRCLGKFGEMFKAILKKLGVECGCDARRSEWNQLYQFK